MKFTMIYSIQKGVINSLRHKVFPWVTYWSNLTSFPREHKWRTFWLSLFVPKTSKKFLHQDFNMFTRETYTHCMSPKFGKNNVVENNMVYLDGLFGRSSWCIGGTSQKIVFADILKRRSLGTKCTNRQNSYYAHRHKIFLLCTKVIYIILKCPVYMVIFLIFIKFRKFWNHRSTSRPVWKENVKISNS